MYWNYKESSPDTAMSVIERLVYMNYLSFVSWVETILATSPLRERWRQKPETGWESISRDSRRLHWVFSENSPKKQISLSRWSFQSVWVLTFLVIASFLVLCPFIYGVFFIFSEEKLWEFCSKIVCDKEMFYWGGSTVCNLQFFYNFW